MKKYPLLNYAPRYEGVWGNGGIDHEFLTSAMHGDGFTPGE